MTIFSMKSNFGVSVNHDFRAFISTTINDSALLSTWLESTYFVCLYLLTRIFHYVVGMLEREARFSVAHLPVALIVPDLPTHLKSSSSGSEAEDDYLPSDSSSRSIPDIWQTR